MENIDTPIHNELYILFPECDPTHFFIIKNPDFQTEEEIGMYLGQLDSFLKLIDIENYIGYYDVENIKAFLLHYDILEDLYLISPRKILRRLLKEWDSWREKRDSNESDEYKVVSTPTSDNSFGEIHSRIIKNQANCYLLISHNAICLKNQIVELEHTTTRQKKNIECRELENAREWFVNNRKPKRIYHASPKHGENGKGEWCNASKLLCSHLDAEKMLHKAVGLTNIDELYYFDETHEQYIIFRYEGKIVENKFHAYHLDKQHQINKAIINQLIQLVKNVSV